jgi:hypothetical protein
MGGTGEIGTLGKMWRKYAKKVNVPFMSTTTIGGKKENRPKVAKVGQKVGIAAKIREMQEAWRKSAVSPLHHGVKLCRDHPDPLEAALELWCRARFSKKISSHHTNVGAPECHFLLESSILVAW